MPKNEGFDILHNAVLRTFRDKKKTAYEAARFAKARNKGDIIEMWIARRARRSSCWRTAGLGDHRGPLGVSTAILGLLPHNHNALP